MVRRLIAALFFGAMAIVPALSSPAVAQGPQCMAREDVLELLAARYGETPSAMGVTAGGALIEVMTSEGGATWTLILTSPEGVSCLLAAGEGWRSKEPQSPGERS